MDITLTEFIVGLLAIGFVYAILITVWDFIRHLTTFIGAVYDKNVNAPEREASYNMRENDFPIQRHDPTRPDDDTVVEIRWPK